MKGQVRNQESKLHKRQSRPRPGDEVATSETMVLRSNVSFARFRGLSCGPEIGRLAPSSATLEIHAQVRLIGGGSNRTISTPADPPAMVRPKS